MKHLSWLIIIMSAILLLTAQTEPFVDATDPMFPAAVEDSTKVLKRYLDDLSAAELEDDKPKIAQRAFAAAIIYKRISNPKAAKRYYQQALMAATDIGDSDTESKSLYQIAQLNFLEEDYDSALTYFYRLIDALKHVDQPTELTETYSGIGRTYFAQEKDSLALSYFMKAMDNASMHDLTDLIPGCLVHIASVYEKQGKFPVALSYFERALSMERELGDNSRTIQILNQMAEIYQKEKNAELSIKHAQQALDLSREEKDQRGIRLACTSLATCYKAIGDYKKSLEFLEISLATKDSLFNAEKDMLLANLEASYTIENKETENQLLKQREEAIQMELEKTRWQNIGLGAILVSALALLALLFRLSKSRQRSNQQLQQQKTILEQQAHELKSTEAALREREEMFRGFYEQSPLGIALFNEENNHFTRCNQRLSQLIGYSEEELVHKTIRDITHPDDINSDRESFYNYINGKGGDVYFREKRLVHKNGDTVWVNTSISLLHNDTGEVKSIIVMMSDITEEKKIEEELHLAQAQLLQADKMASLGQLTAGLAHEINNPVNYIYSGIGGLKKNLHALMQVVEEYDGIQSVNEFNDAKQRIESLKEDMDYAEVQEDIEELMIGIKEGAERTGNIVRSLQNFSRTDRDVFTKANIHEGLDSTLFILKNALNEHITVRRDFVENLNEIECYPGQLNQVFMNIITNAIHAIGKQAGEVFIQTHNTADGIQIKIKDTGKGMPTGIQKRIFDPFFTTKEVGKGTGLGLSISYGIIKKHGGSIRVESKEGKGSCFIIELPKQQ
ncbi:MAG: PAS domain S-box protein [Saprospiraceae bacterium]